MQPQAVNERRKQCERTAHFGIPVKTKRAPGLPDALLPIDVWLFS